MKPIFLEPVCCFDIDKRAHVVEYEMEAYKLGRHKKYPDAEKTIATFFATVSDSYNHPGAGEMSQDGHKSQALLAEEFGISRLKVRKILITTGDMHYPETSRIQQLLASGMKKSDACEYLNMAISTLNSFLPYDKGVYKLADVSNYAENSRVYRERRAAVANLHDHLELPDVSVWLWRCICLFQGYPFTTSGRGNRAGTHFTYEVSQAGAGGGRHYQGEQVESFGNELWIVQNKEKREKSISRSSVDYALQIVIDRRNRGEEITGPKQLKIYGASYVYSIYNRFGLV